MKPAIPTLRQMKSKVGHIGYASGNLAKSLQNTTLSLIYLYFLIDIVKISPGIAGTILLVSQIWDGLTDPILGYLIDRQRRRRIVYRRIILCAAPFSALAFIGLFTLPLVGSGSITAWTLIACLLFRLAYTLVDVPHNSLLAAITEDGPVRVELSALRFLFSSIGSLAVFILAAPALNAEREVQPFIIFAVSLSAIYLIVIIPCALLTPRELHQSTPGVPRISFTEVIRDICGNRDLLNIFLVSFISAALLTVFSRMTIFYAETWLGSSALAAWLLGAHFTGQIIAAPLWSALGQTRDKIQIARMAHLSMVFVGLAFLILSPSTLALALAFHFLAGMSLSGFTIMNWAIVPDCIDQTGLQKGARHEATTFGLLTALSKAASGVGMALIGWTLEFAAYPQAAEAESSRPEELIWAMAVPGIVGGLLSVGFLSVLAAPNPSRGIEESQ